MTDEVLKLKMEIEGLRLQLASKEEVLERCLGEIDRLNKQVEDQKIMIADQSMHGERPMGRQAAKIIPGEKVQGRLTNHLFNPLLTSADGRKQELKSSCKITMAARLLQKK